MSGKYMAYVGSYSYTGKAKGITVFDVDVENGRFTLKDRVEITGRRRESPFMTWIWIRAVFNTGVKWKWTILLM